MFVRDVLSFHGNDHRRNHCLCTDNQAAERLCTQPSVSEAPRGIDVRHHVMKQDHQDGNVRVGGVKSTLNDSDILSKNGGPQTQIGVGSHWGLFHEPRNLAMPTGKPLAR
jgi:hypothetical protein